MVSRNWPHSSLRWPVFRRLIGVKVLRFEFDIGCLFCDVGTVQCFVIGVGAIATKIVVTSMLLLFLREGSTLKANVFLWGWSRARTRCTWSFQARGFGRWFRSFGRSPGRCRCFL